MQRLPASTPRPSSQAAGQAPGLFLRLLPLLLLLAAPSFAVPEFTIEAKSRSAGTPLQLEIEVGNWEDHRALGSTLWIDGKEAGRHALKPGTNTIVLEDLRLAAGSHEAMLSSGTVQTKATFTLLPGWLSVVPPLLAILLALISRDVLISLFLGVFGGAMILNGGNPFAALGRSVDRFIVPALADSDHISIVVFTLFLGGMVGLITKSGGTQGIIERLAPYATDRRRGQLATWAMGVLIFFDDYANTLIVGPTMRPITDRLRISREKLAYIVDSTAAPVVCLFPISTWVGFEIGLVDDAFDKLGLGLDAYTTFLASIPYRFYPLFCLLLVVTLAWTRKDFGPMRRAERRAMDTGQLLPPGGVPIADYGADALEPPAEAPRRAINAWLPILMVVLVTLCGLYLTGSAGQERAAGSSTMAWLRSVLVNANSFNALLWASLSGLLTALILPVAQRILRVKQAMEAMVSGFKAMLMALLVLTLAWALGSVCGDLGTAQYLVGLVHGVVAPMWLPALTFVLAAAVAFATGSSWGTMAILEPLVIPIGHNLSVSAGLDPASPEYLSLMAGSIASVLAGSVWGDHCSPISDTTILSSMATGCDHIAHVRTQLPYALSVGVLGIVVGNLGTALGLPVWLALAFGAALIVGFVLFVGKPLARNGSGETPAEA